jgi:hypothetical protein
MRSLQNIAAAVLFLASLGVFAIALEGIAVSGWLGPVVRENLEAGFDAGALFYTEIDVEGLTTSEAVRRGKFGR